MPSRRRFVASSAAVSLVALTGCGWAPLYADRETGPADAELAAVKVAPIPERAGQILALGLRQWLNPTGAPVPSRYLLRTVLTISRLDLGILTFGLGTRARLDVIATFTLYRYRHQHAAAHSHQPCGRVVRHRQQLLFQCRCRGGCPRARGRGDPSRYHEPADRLPAAAGGNGRRVAVIGVCPAGSLPAGWLTGCLTET